MQGIQLCTECRVSAYTVIMGCGCNQASVKADIAGRTSSDNFKFSTVEISFNNAVFLVQNLKDFYFTGSFKPFSG